MGRRRILTALVLAIGIASALSVRLSRPLLHTDEITYMSRVMNSMVRGSVFPVSGDGRIFLNKPPLALWLMRGAFELLGPGSFAARLPSVLAAAATATVLYLFGAAVFGEGVGILAALIFVLTPGPLVLHGLRSATPDALEILLVTSAIAALEFWRRRRRPWMLVCLVGLVAVSAWVKSPFSLLVFVAYLLATEVPARRAGRGTPRFGLTIALVVGFWVGAYLLWLGMLSAATSPRAVAERLLWRQYALRISGELSKAHVQSPDFYLRRMVHDFGPLLLLPAGAVAAGWLASRKGGDSARQDAACLVAWSLAAPVLATVSASKLPWYAYPSYPGIALLLAVSADRLARALSFRRPVQAAILAAGVLVVMVRLPAGRVWLAEAQYRGLAGRLWEIAGRAPGIVVMPASDFRLPGRHDDALREERLFLQILFWTQARSFPRPDSCRVLLVNDLRAVPALGDVREIYGPVPWRSGFLLADRCARDRLAQLSGGSGPLPQMAGQVPTREPSPRPPLPRRIGKRGGKRRAA